MLKREESPMNSNVLVVKISAKKSESTVKTESKKITIDQNKKFTPCKEAVNFQMESVEEVKNHFKHKIPTAIATGLALTLGVAEPTFAQTLGAATSDTAFSGEIVKLFIKGGLMLDVFAIGSAILSPPIIGMVGLFNSNLAHEWTQKLMKALGITLYYQMIIIGLVYLAHLLLGWWDVYLDPWLLFAPSIKPAIQELVREFKP
jgi:hypothetical protein